MVVGWEWVAQRARFLQAQRVVVARVRTCTTTRLSGAHGGRATGAGGRAVRALPSWGGSCVQVFDSAGPGRPTRIRGFQCQAQVVGRSSGALSTESGRRGPTEEGALQSAGVRRRLGQSESRQGPCGSGRILKATSSRVTRTRWGSRAGAVWWLFNKGRFPGIVRPRSRGPSLGTRIDWPRRRGLSKCGPWA